jgi:ribosomal protein S3
MGQKVSPVGLRIGINKDWEAKWYASNKDFSKCLENDIKIRKYVTKNLKDGEKVSGNFAINHDKYIDFIKSIR